MDEMFGELRSLMNAAERDDAWRRQVCDILERAHDEAPETYEYEWLPYLSGFESTGTMHCARSRASRSWSGGAPSLPSHGLH
jgi:hypothetical protein